MKKLFTLIALASMAIGVFADRGDVFEVGGVHYYIDNEDVGDSWVFVVRDDSYTSLTSVTIPHQVVNPSTQKTYGVYGIKESAFENCTSLTEVNFDEEGVVSIGHNAFKGCIGIKSIYISDGNTGNAPDIANSAFVGCTGLETIIWNTDFGGENRCWDNVVKTAGFSNQIKHIIFGDKVTIIDNGKCCNQSYFLKLESVQLGNNVTKIDSYVFSNLKSLTQITLPTKLKCIESSAFQGSGLVSICIPTAVEYVADNAFVDCTALETVVWDVENYAGDNNPFYFSREDKYNLKTFKFGSNVSVIPAGICHALTHLQVVDLSEATAVTEIGADAFDQCDEITSFDIPEGVITIGDRAFYKCSKLQSIAFPSTLTSLGNSVLAECPQLTTVYLPEGLLSIGESAFKQSTKLENITIPSTVTSIGRYAFQECRAIKSVIIPSGVTTISDAAFKTCEAMETLVLPATMTQLSNDAFDYCNALTSVTCYAENPPICSGSTFSSSARDNACLYVPEASMESYRQHSLWGTFKNMKKIVAHIAFDLNGQSGTAPTTQEVDLGGTATKPDDPIVDGYKFMGWYDNEDCEGAPFDFATTIEADMTLYAKWMNISLTLTEGDNTDNLAVFDGVEAIVTVNRGFVADGGWYTLCLPFDMDASLIYAKFGECRIAKLTDVRDKGDGNVYLNFDDVTEIEAGVPYMFMPTATIAADWQVENVTIHKDLKQLNYQLASMSGVYSNSVLPAGAYYLGGDDYLYPYVDGVATKSLRAYFQFGTGAQNVRARAIFNTRGVSTGLHETQKTLPTKYLKKGHLVIRRGEQLFDATGQLLK